MKSKINALVIACVMMSFAAAANPTLFSVTPTASTKVFNINYKAVGSGTVKISIFNSDNELVFTEALSGVTSFVRPYNFSELSEGEYTIVVADKNGKLAEKVNYASNKIESFISVSEIANAENKYALNVSNNGTEDVFVRIYNSENTLLHEQAVKVTGSFGLIYDLNKVKSEANSITFEVATSSGKFEKITF